MPSSRAPDPSPLTSAYARLHEVLPTLRVLEDEPPRHGDGWTSASALAGGGAAVDAFLALDEERALRDYGQPARPDVVATFGLHRYAWHACLLVTMPWFLDRRVPYLPADAVAFHGTRGLMAVRAGEFACLPGDEVAEAPGARVVPDEEALRAEVRSAVAAHLAPVLAGFRPRMRRGTRALWGMVTDEITEGLWYLGHLLGEEDRARAEAELLLPGGTAPYPGGASFRELTIGQGNQVHVTRDRVSCCLFYTLRPEDTCVTCPRMGDDERRERLAGAH